MEVYQDDKEIVAVRAYGLLLTSPRLARQVLPEGLICSPYEILDYTATLTLHDAKGARATFERRQRVRFLQDGVSAILDHAWGDGVVMTAYHNDAGRLADWFRDGARRHLVIDLGRRMRKGAWLSFRVERQ